MSETVTLEEYRDVIARARNLVVAWRDADARAELADDADRIEWFNQWRDDAITKYNSLPQFLITPNPDMLATRLDEIRGNSRAMLEKVEWVKVAPEAEEPFRVFARTVRALGPTIPRNDTPEATQAEPLYQVLAGEFEPVQPRRG